MPVIDGDWLVCQRGWALSRPLLWYNGAILDRPKFKETDLWNDNLMSSEIWNCPFSLLFSLDAHLSGFRGRVEKSGRSSTFFFESKTCSGDDDDDDNDENDKRIDAQGVFRRHISISVRRRRFQQMRAEVEEEELHWGGLNSNRWQSAGKTRQEEAEEKMRWDWEREKKTELFFLLRLELLIKQQTYKQKSSNDK